MTGTPEAREIRASKTHKEKTMADVIEPDAALLDKDGVEGIVLAGKTWPIPKLPVKVLRIVVPALSQVMEALEPGKLINGRLTASAAASILSDTQLEIMLKMVFAAVSFGTPKLTKAFFEELPIGMAELFEGLPVIIKQTGMEEAKKGEVPGAGEA